MTTNAVTATQLTYVGPGDTSIVETSTNTAPYTASNVGIIDIPAATSSATVFAIPVGSIAKIKAFKLKNTNTLDMGIRFNSAGADEFQLAPGCEISMSQPVASAANDLTSISVVTTASQVSGGTFEFHVFGD